MKILLYRDVWKGWERERKKQRSKTTTTKKLKDVKSEVLNVLKAWRGERSMLRHIKCFKSCNNSDTVMKNSKQETNNGQLQCFPRISSVWFHALQNHSCKETLCSSTVYWLCFPPVASEWTGTWLKHKRRVGFETATSKKCLWWKQEKKCLLLILLLSSYQKSLTFWCDSSLSPTVSSFWWH